MHIQEIQLIRNPRLLLKYHLPLLMYLLPLAIVVEEEHL